ncbi:MAG: hybrid sensor histidine kinase/response regulator [Aquabacterium sp.]|uniref:ATP-binding response regulator n=1 Tax=Aquabacterium sp. TaxID=1872578 RepID=UPI0025B7E7DD|nr:hybrid sensor histidine kinase/response regulator [Aquabacterium sp.]MBI5926373.1 hybrid sensor histidine kinase/response regulator [Aquabacterium sp.]
MQAHSDQRLLCLSLRGLSEQDAAIWIDMVSSGWRNHPKAVPLQLVGLTLIGVLILKSSLPIGIWLPLYACMMLVCIVVIPLAIRFRRVQLSAMNYQPWRWLLLGWRAVHAVSGGALCALLYGSLTPQWQLPLLITVVVFTYGLTFYAIEDFGLAMVGTAPVVLSLLAALLVHGNPVDHYIAVLLVAAGINGLLAGRAISRRLFDAARTRQRNAVLVQELAREVDEVTRAKAQAEQANREKSEFFASASHDLRQPLYSLQLLSDHLRKQLTTLYQLEVADKLGAALTSMRQLFERMFDVARIDAQKVACQPQHVSVRDLFTSLDHEFALACSEKGLRWSVHPTDDWIWTDPVLAQRMLRNLLENAVRYTAQGEVRLRARRKGNHIHCQVWDTGMGIARADRVKVFDDYFQVQNSARRAQDGLGLGLGVVRRLLALTDTRITLRSRLGKGSCFDIAFQPGEASSAMPLPSGVLGDEALMATESECILVIEDQTNVREAVLTVLNDSGYLALGGDTAMALVKQAADADAWPRAIICDYRLGPSYSGFDAIAELRHEFGDDMPAILVTGDLDPLIQARAAEQGIRVMHKPLDRDQLLTALHEITRPSQG